MRYEKYKNIDLPWLKEIPEHWEIYKAKILSSSIKILNKNNVEKNILSLTLKGVIRNDKEKPIGLSPSDYSTYQIFEKDDLVFKLIDLNNVRTSRIGIVHERGIMSSAYIRVTCNKEIFYPKYAYYWYTKLYVEEVYNKLGSGVRETIAKDELLQYHVPLPPLAEQEQIAKFLDWKIAEIDELIRIEKKKIKLLNDFNFHIIYNSINEISEYQLIPLKRICTVIPGKEVTKEVISTNEGSIRVFGSGDKVFKYTDRTMLSGEHIIFGRKGTIGKPYIVDGGFWIVDTAYAMINNVNSDFKYLYYLMTIFPWDDYSTNTVKPSIVATQVLSEKVKVPIISIQKEVANNIDKLLFRNETQISLLADSIEMLQSLKQSLISEVVTGKIDVRNIEIPELNNSIVKFEYEDFDDEDVENGEFDDEDLEDEYFDEEDE